MAFNIYILIYNELDGHDNNAEEIFNKIRNTYPGYSL